MENTEMINTVEEIVSDAAEATTETNGFGTKLLGIAKYGIVLAGTIITWEKLVKPVVSKLGKKILNKRVQKKLAKAAPVQAAEEDVDPSTITEEDLAID